MFCGVASLILGSLTLGFIMSLRGDDTVPLAKFALIFVVIGAVLIAAYDIAVQASGGSFTQVGYYFDPTHPTYGTEDASATVSSQLPLLWAVFYFDVYFTLRKGEKMSRELD